MVNRFPRPDFCGNIKNVLKNSINFHGRARRTEFWLFVLFEIIIFLILEIIFIILIFCLERDLLNSEFKASDFFKKLTKWYFLIFYAIFAFILFILFIPSLALAVRRLHDVSKSGYWVFIALIPLIGLIVLINFFCYDSERDRNEYGPSPKYVIMLYSEPVLPF